MEFDHSHICPIFHAIDKEEPFDAFGLAIIHWKRDNLEITIGGIAAATVTNIPISEGSGFRPTYMRVVLGEMATVIALDHQVVIVSKASDAADAIPTVAIYRCDLCFVYAQDRYSTEHIARQSFFTRSYAVMDVNEPARPPTAQFDYTPYVLADGTRIGAVPISPVGVAIINGTERKCVYGDAGARDTDHYVISFHTHDGLIEPTAILNGVNVPQDFEENLNADFENCGIVGVTAAEAHRMAMLEWEFDIAQWPFEKRTIPPALSRTVYPYAHPLIESLRMFAKSRGAFISTKLLDVQDSMQEIQPKGLIYECTEKEFNDMPLWMKENGFAVMSICDPPTAQQLKHDRSKFFGRTVVDDEAFFTKLLAQMQTGPRTAYFAFTYGSILNILNPGESHWNTSRAPYYVTTDHLTVMNDEYTYSVTSYPTAFTIPMNKWKNYYAHRIPDDANPYPYATYNIDTKQINVRF